MDWVLCLQQPRQSEEHSRRSKKGPTLKQEISIGWLQFHFYWLDASTLLRAGCIEPRVLKKGLLLLSSRASTFSV